MIIIQARTTSTRLPGKVLMEVMGKPLIWYLVENMKLTGEKIVLATPREDWKLAEWAVQNDVIWFGGDEHDVAARFVACLAAYPCDWFVRVCADSPLLDHRVVRAVVNRKGYDFVSNVDGGFPSGQHVEMARTDVFLKHDKHPEHVMPPLYDLPNKFIVKTIPSDWPGMAVDTAGDFERISRVIEEAGGQPWKFTWRELQTYA